MKIATFNVFIVQSYLQHGGGGCNGGGAMLYHFSPIADGSEVNDVVECFSGASLDRNLGGEIELHPAGKDSLQFNQYNKKGVFSQPVVSSVEQGNIKE